MARRIRYAAPLFARGAILLAVAVIGLAVALALTPATAHAVVVHSADTGITGTVINGTHGDAAVANAQVTLHAMGGNGTRDLASTTTDNAGRFAFAQLPDAGSSIYAVYTRFQQAYFTTGAIAVQGGTQDVRLTVYDVTSSDASLRVSNVTVLVRDPRPVNGLIGVGESFTFHNSGNTAFLGTTQPANGMPMNLLRFALPDGATNVKLGAGFGGAQSAQVAGGFGAAATVPPGDSQVAFAFDLPYTGTQALLPIKAEYPTDTALLLVPPSITVTPTGLDARGPISSNGEQYNAFTHGAFDPGATVRAKLGTLPAAGEPSTLDFGQLVVLAGLLALLLALLLAHYLRRGSLTLPGWSFLPHQAESGSVGTHDDAEGASERGYLLGQLLRLRHARESGQLSATQYRRESAEVRAALRELLASTLRQSQDDAAAPQIDASTAPGGTTDDTPSSGASVETLEQPAAIQSTSDASKARAVRGGSR